MGVGVLTRLVSCVSIMKLCTCFSALVSSSFRATTATTSAVQPAPYKRKVGARQCPVSCESQVASRTPYLLHKVCPDSTLAFTLQAHSTGTVSSLTPLALPFKHLGSVSHTLAHLIPTTPGCRTTLISIGQREKLRLRDKKRTINGRMCRHVQGE